MASAGNASPPSNEVSGLPHLVIGWANLQWPPSMTHVISAIDRTDNAYGQVWIDGLGNLLVQVGTGSRLIAIDAHIDTVDVLVHVPAAVALVAWP